MNLKTLLLALSVFTILTAATQADTPLVDHTLDGVANDTGGLTFQQVKNTLSNGENPVGSSNLNTGVITTGQGTGVQGNSSTYGFNTSAPFNVSAAAPAATGFAVTFTVVGTTANVGSLTGNGLFLGVVTGTDANGTGGTSLWNNNPYAIGYVSSSDNYGAHLLRQDAEGGVPNDGNSTNTAFANTPTLASYQNGFTITLSLFNDDTWSLTSTGLSTNIDSTGSLATGTGMKTYAQIASAVTPYMSLQGEAQSTITIDSITVTAIEAPVTGYSSPFVDSDGDGYRDEAEIAMGSDPNDASNIPKYTPNPAKPNVVIIYTDDLGFGDISRYGNLFGTPSASPTPNVDSLADQGVTFTQAYSANAVCTPSRYSLLTGIYNWRNFQSISGHYGYKSGIDNIPLDSDVTLAEFLKTQGYDTAAFGKWHLGGKWYAPGTNNRIISNPSNPAAVDWTRRIEGHATDIGFDYFRGLGAVINFGPYVYLHDDIVQYWVEDGTALNEYGNKLPNGRKGYFRNATGTDSFSWFTTGTLNSTVVGATDSRESLGDPSYRQIDAGPVMIADFERYIDERVASNDTDPFFTYVALYSPHKPWAITPEFNNSTYGSFDYARWMAEVDDRIGRIIAAIDDNGMANDTLIIMTSDNGPETTAMTNTLANGADANGPLRGAKRDVWEGGTRVPFIVRWPGQAPAGMIVTDELISQVDIFPTIAAFLGAELPATTAPDGESFLNVLRGQRKPGPERGGVVLCSVHGHLALKTPDGWKLIDSTGGGGNANSWDSDNKTIPSAVGTNQGTPKQLFHMPTDLGEDNNLIADLTGEPAIRSELVALSGRDLLATLDALRASGSASLYPREPDNDGDGMPNWFEDANGLDRDDPRDAALDNDGDGADNLSEYIAGTDPNDPGSIFRIVDLQNSSASLSVSWPSVAGRTYEVFWSTDLTTWTSDSTHPGTDLEITVPLDKPSIDAADGIPGNLRSLFIRVGVVE